MSEIFDQLFSDIAEMQSRIHRATKPALTPIGHPAVGDASPRRKISHSYYVVMRDHGKLGLEAIVHPEDTRRKIVERIKSGEFEHIVFIHHVDGLYIEDVTEEIMDEVELLSREDA